MKRLVPVLLLISISAYSQQTQSDSYTRYEMLEPGSSKFRIIYDVSATSEGAEYYFNTLRKGSEHEVSEVVDLMTGDKLDWEIVPGDVAKKNGHLRASADTDYLQVKLARPVPKDGEGRIRIDKTYKDDKSYYADGDNLVFERSLGIRRNSLLLPEGYELLSCNYPSQVEMEYDGRVKVSFMNTGVQSVPYRVVAKPLGDVPSLTGGDENPWPDYKSSPSGPDRRKARLNYELNERAFQNREIVYYLLDPDTHSFRLYHDYTETRPGVDKYLNVVRAGSKATDPSAFILDTGEELKVETLRGKEISEKGIELNNLTEDTEVVVIWFDPVKEGGSTRLRIWETYTDPNRYLLYNDELVWDRQFGRNRNSVVLPEGWYLTTSSIPAVISQNEKGQVRLDFVNPRPDQIDVFIRARRR